MHYHGEVVIPLVHESPNSTTVTEAIVAQVMDWFHTKDECNGYRWYDYYTIGGRFSGQKLICTLDQEKIEAFDEELQKRKSHMQRGDGR